MTTTRTTHLLYLIITILFVCSLPVEVLRASVSTESAAAQVPATLYFRSGFESDVNLHDYQRFTGPDRSTGFDWSRLGDMVPAVREFNFKYWGGVCPEDAYVDIIDDPEGQRGRILHAQVNSDSGGGVRCRTGGSLHFDREFEQLCVRYRYKISEAYQAVVDNNIGGWWLISELWTTGPEHDRASMPLYLHKGDGYFWFRQTLRARQENSFETLWEVKNEDFRIPLGRWVEVVHLVRPGPAGVGRIYLSMDGQQVLDIQDKPIAWEERHWKNWTCLKLYEGLPITDFLRERGTPAQVWYDDFEIWSDIPVPERLNIGGGHTVYTVTANSFEENDKERFSPNLTRDGSLERNSTWRAEPEHGHDPWIAYDLGTPKTIKAAKIAFMQTRPRTFTFSIQTADCLDGPWTTALDCVTSTEGKADLETFAIGAVRARFIRLVGHGGSHPDFPRWTCISELEIH
jgi:hypothetical protein